MKKLVHQCIKCKRYHARLGNQWMAALPEERLALEEPFFTYTSVDLFGQFEVKRALDCQVLCGNFLLYDVEGGASGASVQLGDGLFYRRL